MAKAKAIYNLDFIYENKNYEVIVNFIAGWKVKMIGWWQLRLTEYIAARETAEANYTPDASKPEYVNRNRASTAGYEAGKAYLKKYGITYSEQADYMHNTKYALEKLEKDYTREAEARLLKIVTKIEESIGKVVYANLHVNEQIGFDGYVVGTEKGLKIETIMAGGYNIQRLHYRTLYHVYDLVK